MASVVDDRYEVIELLGAGGMSSVYHAYDRRLEREVALKFVRTAHDIASPAQLLQEARLMAGLRHPNVLPIYDMGSLGPLPYLVLPYLAGEDLRSWARSKGGPPIDIALAVAVLDEACQGLIALHDAKVVHYDIKPENILVSPTNHVAIADLGLANFTRNADETAQVQGTPGFIAPEHIVGRGSRSRQLAPAADVYAMGVTAYWLLSGEHPFKGPDTQATFRRQVEQSLPKISTRADVHPAFDAPLRAAARRDPKKRCTARELRRALLAAEETRRQGAARPTGARVVLVDDDPDILAMVEAIVAAALPDAEVLPFARPVAALEEIRARPPTAVITDLDMPELDGASLVREIRSDPAAAKIPVVVLTGVGSASDWQGLRNAGASKFLVKPIDPELLHDVVRRLHA